MSYPFDIIHPDTTIIKEGKIGWRCPSNIAIVKYWGKYGVQLPRNASLSFTLSNAFTETYISYKKNEKSGMSINFKFEGEKKPDFARKIVKYLNNIAQYIPVLNHLHLDIESSNSFPHSSGIASSASAMAAISMCVCSLENEICGGDSDINTAKASYLARLGSGSASRSIIPYFGSWGAHPQIQNSSNLHATFVEEVHPIFKSFHDDILIVSKSEKSVSSTAGHALMDGNIYADARYNQANSRIGELVKILKNGEVEAFGKMAEEEALTLHALMMCSDPSYVLMEGETLMMIKEIRAYRNETNLPVYFTLDAGPNIHLLYPSHIKLEIEKFISERLMRLTEEGIIIKDKIGNGPKRLI